MFPWTHCAELKVPFYVCIVRCVGQVSKMTRSHLSVLLADGDRIPSSLCCFCLRFLLLFFLALLLSCGILFCLQCWLKQRSCLPHQRTLAVFALGSSDAFHGQSSLYLLWDPTSPNRLLRLPPSYEDIMKGNKL
uniref:Transmembrane protein 207 n=1 Tax=Nothoprocta perdicaria TaxID=30464 RepID=A0A8C6Z6Q3_NOTPE